MKPQIDLRMHDAPLTLDFILAKQKEVGADAKLVLTQEQMGEFYALLQNTPRFDPTCSLRQREDVKWTGLEVVVG